MWVLNALVLSLRVGRVPARGAGRPTPSEARRYALRSFPATIGEHLGSRLDQWIVGAMAALGSAGIYSVALGLTDALTLPGLALGSSLFAAASRSELPDDFPRKPLTAAIAVAATGAVLLAATAPWTIPLVFGERYRGAIVPTMVLALGAIGFGVQRSLGPYLSGRGRPGYYSLSSLTSATVLAVSVVILLPRFGLVGAAIGSAAGYLAGGSVALIAALRARQRTNGVTASSVQA
jgi:O-antigen/teichoic acid export membrane protein